MIAMQFRIASDDNVTGCYWNSLCRRKNCPILAQRIYEQQSVNYLQTKKTYFIFALHILHGV